MRPTLGVVHQLQLPAALDLTRGIAAWVDARPVITNMRAAGHGPAAIARHLNAQGVPTPAGLLGRWRPETVGRVAEPERWAAYMREYRRRRRA